MRSFDMTEIAKELLRKTKVIRDNFYPESIESEHEDEQKITFEFLSEVINYLEYESKQKDERIQDFKNALNEAGNELSRLSHENGYLKSQLQQQVLPVLPEFVAEWYEEEKDSLEFAVYNINTLIDKKSLNDRTKIEKWFARADNKPIETVFKMKDGYQVENRSCSI
ncbi:gp124 (endogenous virus) [Lactococcus phage KSY1]|uniref:Gp124 n=1 Tax=Lactococcus phage KSY1 TaxID=2913972 RepID=A6MAI9_9CAUD|nr:gp124 [Lactococcus phage KSY1]ABG21667.1 gp124 [Lactococcus phage KSY1]